MKLFLESINTEEVSGFCEDRIIEGVVTTAQLFSQTQVNIKDTLAKIGALVGGSLLTDVMAEDYETIIKHADTLTNLADNICVSIPILYQGLRACREIKAKHHLVCMKYCFNVHQALLAAKADSDYIAIDFAKLLSSQDHDKQLIADIRNLYNRFGFKTKILAVSIESLDDLKTVMLQGADCAAISAALLHQIMDDTLTNQSLITARKEWKKIGPISD